VAMRTGRRFHRLEGVVLLAIYLVFMTSLVVVG
jgi:Ca2+/Na+ antiporter